MKIIRERALKVEGGAFYVHGDTVHYTYKSLFCFSHENRLRKAIVWLITW
jgi:hypothetical protein